MSNLKPCQRVSDRHRPLVLPEIAKLIMCLWPRAPAGSPAIAVAAFVPTAGEDDAFGVVTQFFE
jgi:hypothetical protein